MDPRTERLLPLPLLVALVIWVAAAPGASLMRLSCRPAVPTGLEPSGSPRNPRGGMHTLHHPSAGSSALERTGGTERTGNEFRTRGFRRPTGGDGGHLLPLARAPDPLLVR